MILKIIILVISLIIVIVPAIIFTVLNRKNIASSGIAGLSLVIFFVSLVMFPLTIYRLITKTYQLGDVIKHIDNEKEWSLMTEYKLEFSVKALREARNITQQQLSDDIMITRTYLSQIENNRIDNITITLVQLLADYFGVEVHEIVRVSKVGG